MTEQIKIVNGKPTGTSKCSVNPLPVCPRTPNDALSSIITRTLYLNLSSIFKESYHHVRMVQKG